MLMQTVWTQSKTSKMPVLIWIQIVWHSEYLEIVNFERKSDDDIKSRKKQYAKGQVCRQLPFAIHQKYFVVTLLCLVIFSAFVIVYHERSDVMRTFTAKWLLQHQFDVTGNALYMRRKNREKQTWPLVDIATKTSSNQNDNKTWDKVHRVLWYNKGEWMHRSIHANKTVKNCRYNNCIFTNDLSLITRSAAVVFCISCPGMPMAPPVSRSLLPENQIWIFFSLESPINIPKHNKNYKNSEWRDVMNWSMTYRLDSNIPYPYGSLKYRNVPRTRNYTEIFQRKTKTAAWVVSHCRTESKREVFVEEMRKHGLDIDVYGACGTRLTEEPEQLINRDYKFYLSFENSLCKDYITEKFFKYFNLDTILVVRGGADYSQLLPNDTFIDTSKFKTIKELVSYLMGVSSSEELYTNYIRNKDKYISVRLKDANPFCVMCEKLNNIDKNRNSHRSIVSSVFENACHEPIDIL